MNFSALPLILGVYGLVRMCLGSRQAVTTAKDLQHEPLSVITRDTVMPGLL